MGTKAKHHDYGQAKNASQTRDQQNAPRPLTVQERAQLRALDLTPTDIYWDPRYNNYFYAGVLQSEGGTMADVIVPVIEAQSSPIGAEQAGPWSRRRRPILTQSPLQRPLGGGRSISWTEKPLVKLFELATWTSPVTKTPDDSSGILGGPPIGNEAKSGQWNSLSVCLDVCIWAMVLLLAILLSYWVWLFLDNYGNADKEVPESSTDPDELAWLRQATTEGVALENHNGDEKPVSTIPENTEPNGGGVDVAPTESNESQSSPYRSILSTQAA